MTDDEQAALAWLDYYDHAQARTLKRMLAQPRLPENPTDELVEAMYRAYHKTARTMHGTGVRGAYRALYQHLTKPRTKTVWTVAHTDPNDEGTGGVDQFDRWPDATAQISQLVDEGMRVTVARREVPA